MRLALCLFAVLLRQGLEAQNSGSIEGFVLKLGTSTPVAGARVDVRNEEIPVSVPRIASTDDSGHFALRNLPPGRYRVSASHDEYVSVQYEERSRGGRPAAITLEPSQEIKGLVLAMTPKGAI